MILLRSTKSSLPSEYGIDIPVGPEKVSKTLKSLETHPILRRHKEIWYRSASGIPITRDDLCRVHSTAYVEKLFSDGLEEEILRTYELVNAKGHTPRYHPERATRPLKDLLERSMTNLAGSYECGRLALESDFCFYFGGGGHHGQRDRGNGFCLLNDVVVAARKLQADDGVRNIWIIDVDAHRGDGTALLTQNDESVRTLSIHMAKGWPLDRDPYDKSGQLHPSFIPGDIDIPVDSGEEVLYVPRLKAGLDRLAEFPIPDVAIVVSGVDPYEKDELPSTRKIRLTKDQLRNRDRLVYRFLEERSIPRAYLMAGGYGKSSWEVYSEFLSWALLRHLFSQGIT